MYGPAVRCKRFVDLVVSGLASMYPVSSWSCFAPDHHGYQRACDLISGQASTGPFGSPVFACAGKTEPPSLLILSQTSAGKSYRFAYVSACSSSFSAHLALYDQAAWAVALVFVLASKFRPRARTLQAMRASLLASAIASTLRCSRFLAASIQGLSPWRSQLLGLISTTQAACTNSTRR